MPYLDVRFNMSRNRIISLTIITLVFLLGFRWCRNEFFNSDEDFDPIVSNFQPSQFSYSSVTPIYYYANNKLYFSENGAIDFSNDPIWKGKIERSYERYVMVSPNSEFIALNHSFDEIVILKKTGELIAEISPVSEYLKRFDEGSLGSFFQWSQDSKTFYYLKDSYVNSIIQTSIYGFSTTQGKHYLVKELGEKCTENFYVNRNNNHIYYQASIEGDLVYKKVSIDIPTRSMVMDTVSGWEFLNPDSTFINYFVQDFGNYSYDFKRLVKSTYGTSSTPGLYYHTDSTNQIIIESTHGYRGFKGNSFSLHKGGEFLPDNRYYVARVHASNLEGTLLIDTKTLKYMHFESIFECFYSITNDQQPNFKKNYKFETSVRI